MNYTQVVSDIINSLPEIKGSFLCSPDHEILVNQANHIVSLPDQQQLSEKLYAIASLGSSRFNDVLTVQIGFKNIQLSARILPDGNQLIIFHLPKLSPSMLKMTVQLALNPAQSEQEDETFQSTDDPYKDEETPEETALISELLDPEYEFAELFSKIQDELAQYIGPVAELIFRDSLLAWCRTYSPVRENLTELVPILEVDLETDDEKDSFRKNVTELIEQG